MSSGRLIRTKLAYFVSHPIQYQAPLLRLLAKDSEIDLTVIFCSDHSVKAYHDEEFGVEVSWDVPLLDGYKSIFLPRIGKSLPLGFFRPLCFGIYRTLRLGEFDVLWVHGWGYFTNVSAILFAKVLGIKVLMRGESYKPINKGRVSLRAKLLHIFLKLFINGFLVIGTMNRAFYRSIGVPDRKLFDCPYAVDNEYFNRRLCYPNVSEIITRRNLRIGEEAVVILYASKLTRRKGLLHLIDAYANLMQELSIGPVIEVHLLIIGNGELMEEAIKRVENDNNLHIQFLGFKNQSELPMYYGMSDIFVLPSYDEPWGLVINEAMNGGCAIVTTSEVGAGLDLVVEGVNGKIVPPRDVLALKEALKDLLLNRNHLAEYGEQSKKLIKQWGFHQDIAGIRQAISVVLERERHEV